MKLLLLLAVLFFAVWLWRRGRSLQRGEGPAAPPYVPEVTAMTDCRHCQLHFPAEEGVHGRSGTYCSSAHRSAAGDSAAAP